MTEYEVVSIAIQHWSLAVSVIVMLLLLANLIVLGRQTRAAVGALVGSPHDRIASQIFVMDQVFIDHPDMRPYFHAGENISEEHESFSLALSISEMRLDFLDQVIQQYRLLPGLWSMDRWEPHIVECFRRSPLMFNHLVSIRNSYSDKLWALRQEAAQASDAAASRSG